MSYGKIVDGIIIKEYSESAEGLVFKSQEAFDSKKGVCYINCDGNSFTYQDFLSEAVGNTQLANWCFESMVDTWNYPDSYFEDGIEEGYFIQCTCAYLIDHHIFDKCPSCGSKELIAGDWDFKSEQDYNVEAIQNMAGKYSFYVYTSKEVFNNLKLWQAMEVYAKVETKEYKAIGVSKDGVYSCDMLINKDGKNKISQDYMKLEHFKDDSLVTINVKTLLELSFNL